MSSGTNATRVVSGPARWLLQALAVLSLVMGLIGIVVPVLPTVPFLLLSAWAASRSWPRLAVWLESHPRFGHYIRNWREARVVPRRAKWFATVMMSASGISMLVVIRPLWLPILVVSAMLAVGVWLWRRPERRPDVQA